jgi:tetratricopeptide (TPR) repeat protein
MQVADRLVEQFPESPHALTLAGSIYHAFGEQASADRCWEKSLTIAPDFAPTSQRMGEAAWERGEYDLAVSHLRRAVAADPSSISPLTFFLAESLMNLGNTGEAIDVLEQAARQRRLSVDETSLLGHGYLQMGQYDKARDRLVAGLQIDPASSKIHFGLATVYARLGQLEASRKHREEYARLQSQKLDMTTGQRGSLRAGDLGNLHPFALMTYVNAGKIHAAQGDIRQAEKYWLRAVEVDPQHPEPRRWLELLYQQEGRQEEAACIRQGANSGQDPSKEARDE